MIGIYLRHLEKKDADISYKWRNNPLIWEYTLRKPDKKITKNIEQQWISQKLSKKDEICYAICLEENDEYIGNIYLTNVTNIDAEFHIFIGETKYWGKGIATTATQYCIENGFTKLNLKKIYLHVNKNNLSAVKIYKKCGFVIEYEDNNILYMYIINESFNI